MNSSSMIGTIVAVLVAALVGLMQFFLDRSIRHNQEQMRAEQEAERDTARAHQDAMKDFTPADREWFEDQMRLAGKLPERKPRLWSWVGNELVVPEPSITDSMANHLERDRRIMEAIEQHKRSM